MVGAAPPSSHVRLHKQLGTSKSGSDQHMLLMSGPGQPKPSQLRGNPPNSPKVKGGEAGTTSTSTNRRCNILQSFRFLADQLSIRSKLLEHIVPETVKVKVGEVDPWHSYGSPTCCHLRFPSFFHTFSFTCLSSMCYCLCNVTVVWYIGIDTSVLCVLRKKLRFNVLAQEGVLWARAILGPRLLSLAARMLI